MKAVQARVRQVGLKVEQAQLQLARMVVKAPISGRVLELIARPGTRVMGMGVGSGQDATSVVSLYDPNMLQVRADVWLEDVPMIQVGQPVRIETASSKEPLEGKVLFATSSADIQKNTLEVKVAIDSPPATIRPEMLVTTTFFALPTPENESGPSEQLRLLVPRQVVESAEDTHVVWVAEPNGIARKRSVRLGPGGTEELVEVVEGLSLNDTRSSRGRRAASEVCTPSAW